jgi:hypothetical protein
MHTEIPFCRLAAGACVLLSLGVQRNESPYPGEPTEGRRLEGWPLRGPGPLPSFETRAKALSSERVKASPEGVATPQNVEYSTPK